MAFATTDKNNTSKNALCYQIISLFKIACLAFTIYIVYGWIHRYSLHKLSSVIDVKNFFETENDVSPVFSICVTDPKLDEKIKALSPEFNESSYIKFLQGNLYSEQLKQLNFDQVKFNWSEYLHDPPKAHIVSPNGKSKGFYNSNTGKYSKYYTSYIGLQSRERFLTYCLAFEPLSPDVHAIIVRLNKTIFKDGKIPDFKFRIFHHYPNQIIRSYQSVKYTWDDLDKKIDIITFTARDIEVLHRVENKRSSCIKDWKNYDKVVTQQHLRKIGCRRPYQECNEVKNICPNKKAMSESLLYPSNIVMKQFNPPCRSLEKANYIFLGNKTFKNNLPENVFEIKFFFDYRYKEILQYEQIDLEVSWISNYNQ